MMRTMMQTTLHTWRRMADMVRMVAVITIHTDHRLLKLQHQWFQWLQVRLGGRSVIRIHLDGFRGLIMEPSLTQKDAFIMRTLTSTVNIISNIIGIIASYTAGTIIRITTIGIIGMTTIGIDFPQDGIVYKWITIL